MKIAHFALASVALLLPTRWVAGKYDRADAKLSAFYADMQRGDPLAARIDIGDAIQLWDWNGRYYALRGYTVAQALPVHFSRADQDRKNLTVNELAIAQIAIRDYSRALSLNDRDAVAHQNLAWLKHLTGDDISARSHWQRALQDDPEEAVFHLSYAMFLEGSGDTKQAHDEIKTALELSPSLVDSSFFENLRLQDANASDALVRIAISDLQLRNDRHSDPILEARLGKLFLFSGDAQSAATALRHAVDTLPDLSLAWLNLGRASALLGKTEEAIECYRRSNILDSLNPGPYFGMADIYLRKGQKQVARRYILSALNLPRDTFSLTAAHDNQLYLGPYQRGDTLIPDTLPSSLSPCWTAEISLESVETSFPDESGLFTSLDKCSQRHR